MPIMSETTQPVADNGTNTPAAENTQTNAGEQQAQQPTQQDSKDFKAVKAQLNAERKAREELESKLKAIDEEKLKAEGKKDELLARREQELQEIKNRYNSEKRNYLLDNALRSAGANSELIDLAIEALKSQVQFSDENEPLDLDTRLQELKATKPSLFSTTAKAGDVGMGMNNAAVTGGLSVAEAQAILKSGNSDLFAKHRDQINALQREGKLY